MVTTPFQKIGNRIRTANVGQASWPVFFKLAKKTKKNEEDRPEA